MMKLSNQDDKKQEVSIMQALTQEQKQNITKKVVVTWSNPYSKIKDWDQSQYERKAHDCAERLLMHAHWDLEEEEEEEFLRKINSGCYPEDFSEKEQKIFFDIEEGNTYGGQIGNYGLCVKRAQEAWRQRIIINDNFFMPFFTKERQKKKEEKQKNIFIVMYHEAVDYEYNNSYVEAVFKSKKEAEHWIAAKMKEEKRKKRQTLEFIRKGGDEYNLPYEKKYQGCSWEKRWYTIDEKEL